MLLLLFCSFYSFLDLSYEELVLAYTHTHTHTHIHTLYTKCLLLLVVSTNAKELEEIQKKKQNLIKYKRAYKNCERASEREKELESSSTFIALIFVFFVFFVFFFHFKVYHIYIIAHKSSVSVLEQHKNKAIKESAFSSCEILHRITKITTKSEKSKKRLILEG